MCWKCPECQAEIVHLNYDVNTTSSEYGRAYLRETEAIRETGSYRRVSDHDYSDTGDSDWDGDPTYKCPECDYEVELEGLIWVDENDEENEDEEAKAPKEPTELDHAIIHPQNQIIKKEIGTDPISFTLLCKTCRNPLLCEKVFNTYKSTNDGITECKCGTLNTQQEFLDLLGEGYFNKEKLCPTKSSK
jgi:hypothetical protein